MKPLQQGDTIRVIAPSLAMGVIKQETLDLAQARLEDMGFRVTFGASCYEKGLLKSASLQTRIQDINSAFLDPEVRCIMPVIGGYNAISLLPYLDYDLIQSSDKVFCGFSDITVLQNALFAKTGFQSWSGPNFNNFGMKEGAAYTLEIFQKVVSSLDSYSIEASPQYSDDKWRRSEENREFIDNPGPQYITPGEAQGTVIGGNLCSLNLLQGTLYMPSLAGSILFIEEDDLCKESTPYEFDRNLESLLLCSGGSEVRGLVLGRFERGSQMTTELLREIIRSKPQLSGKPVIYDVDFGHTTPQAMIPIGGKCLLKASPNGISVTLSLS